MQKLNMAASSKEPWVILVVGRKCLFSCFRTHNIVILRSNANEKSRKVDPKWGRGSTLMVSYKKTVFSTSLSVFIVVLVLVCLSAINLIKYDELVVAVMTTLCLSLVVWLFTFVLKLSLFFVRSCFFVWSTWTSQILG